MRFDYETTQALPRLDLQYTMPAYLQSGNLIFENLLPRFTSLG